MNTVAKNLTDHARDRAFRALVHAANRLRDEGPVCRPGLLHEATEYDPAVQMSELQAVLGMTVEEALVAEDNGWRFNADKELVRREERIAADGETWLRIVHTNAPGYRGPRVERWTERSGVWCEHSWIGEASVARARENAQRFHLDIAPTKPTKSKKTNGSTP